MKINQETVTFDDIGHWETQAAEALAASDAVFDCTEVKSADSPLLALIFRGKIFSPKSLICPRGCGVLPNFMA